MERPYLWRTIDCLDRHDFEETLACDVPGGMLVRVEVTRGPFHGDETPSVSVSTSVTFVPGASVAQWLCALGQETK